MQRVETLPVLSGNQLGCIRHRGRCEHRTRHVDQKDKKIDWPDEGKRRQDSYQDSPAYIEENHEVALIQAVDETASPDICK